MITKFRPCIDLHNGKVKQIVGGSLKDSGEGLKENFVSKLGANEYAAMYKRDRLKGGHVIQLGSGNTDAAESALAEYPNNLQIGGGINLENATNWLEKGASHIIVTSWLFDKDGIFQWSRLKELMQEVGREHLVIDLSCRQTEQGWTVAMNRWQTLTNIQIQYGILDELASYCDEFLIHAADVEGLCNGVDLELVKYLGAWKKLTMTYAGGVGTIEDVHAVDKASQGNINLTVGSALDIFGGSGVKYNDLVKWNSR